jgi:hypothetical protein
LVGSGGAPLFQGRSLTCRFAMLAPFWAGAIAEATPLAPGQTRALTGAVLDYFVSHGAIGPDGLAPIGWHGRFDKLRQLYTGGPSVMWLAKGFIGLLLPDRHEVWRAQPAPPEPWLEPSAKALPAPGWLVSTSPAAGLVRVVNHGSDHAKANPLEPRPDDPFYQRLDYSNWTAPSLAPSSIAAPLDANVTLIDAAGAPAHRGRIHRILAQGRLAASRSRVYWLDLPGGPPGDGESWAALRRGPWLTCLSVLRGASEVRLAWWDAVEPDLGLAPLPGTDLDFEAAWPRDLGPWRVHFGGPALAAERTEALRVVTAPGHAEVVAANGLASSLVSVRGLEQTGSVRLSGADPFGPASASPWLRSAAPLPERQVCAAWLTLGPPTPSADRPTAALAVAGDSVQITWSDGQIDAIDLASAIFAPPRR